MRFGPLQRSLAHAALSEGATSRTIPLRCSSPMRFYAHKHAGQASTPHSGRNFPTKAGRAPDPHLESRDRPLNDPSKWAATAGREGHGLAGTGPGPDGVPGVAPFAALVLASSCGVFPRRSAHVSFTRTRPPRGFCPGERPSHSIGLGGRPLTGLGLGFWAFPTSSCARRPVPGGPPAAMGFSSSRFSDMRSRSPFFERFLMHRPGLVTWAGHRPLDTASGRIRS